MLQAHLFQHADRGGVIGPNQPEHFGQVQGFKRQHQRIAGKLSGIALPPGLHGKTVAEVDAPLSEVVERCDTAKADEMLWGFTQGNRPPAITVARPLCEPVVEQPLRIGKACQGDRKD